MTAKSNSKVRPLARTEWTGLSKLTEFCTFVEHAEKELWQLFKTIDRDHNGKVDKAELNTAFKRAGVTLEEAKLASFFDRIDSNHDGEISFEEWRYVHKRHDADATDAPRQRLSPVPADPQP